ncbi:MAG: hypothetical protein J5750_03205 [Clostridiales bacterium]|nr:hypothetical protein [Clostridiales bacterium]
MPDNYRQELNKNATAGSSLSKMEMLVSAMWELMLEKGFTREQLNAKLDRVRETNPMSGGKQAVGLCPECKTKVTENPRTPFEGKCIYCGNTVTIYPGDSIENTYNGSAPAQKVSAAEPDLLSSSDDDWMLV